MSGQDTDNTQPTGLRRAAFLVPLALFLALAGVFLVQLLSGRDNTTVPSALIGQPAPAVTLGALGPLPLLAPDAFAKPDKPVIVNVWASWCAPCREEHPLLVTLGADERFVVAGINYKDDPGRAQAFLSELGNPFDVIGTDTNGRAAIEWGVYGVPETFIVGRDGRIAYKHVGPLTEQSLSGPFGAALEAAIAAANP
jgi:cytochrome c biogenesis protein CcmG/thiol:disulfide interchange protein DsbE